MRTRCIVAGLWFFAISCALGTVFAVLAPLSSIRVFSLIAAACAVAGFSLQLYALRDADPPAFMLLWRRVQALVSGLRMFARNAPAASNVAVPDITRSTAAPMTA